jgi:DNA-binding transcriptional ArsR family regulator
MFDLVLGVALTAQAKETNIGNRMVTNIDLDRTFGALADATRRSILTRLAQGDATVGELARPFRVSRPAISKHLRVLERAKLVRRTREGRISRCRLDAAAIRDAAAWVERYRRFWEGQLDQLARYIEGKQTWE